MHHTLPAEKGTGVEVDKHTKWVRLFCLAPDAQVMDSGFATPVVDIVHYIMLKSTELAPGGGWDRAISSSGSATAGLTAT